MFSVFVLTRTIEERMDDPTGCNSLTKPERHMLINLGVPRRMGQIAENLNTQPSTVTAVADALEAKGLVIRDRDPNDRRAWQLSLTDTGQKARRDLIDATVQEFRDITGLDDDEVATLASLMDKLSAYILKTGFPKGLTL